MPANYYPEGTSPAPVSGWTKIAITSTTNATPVVVTASSAPATGDTIEIEGTGTVDGQWQVTKLSPTTFSLNGSTAPGSTGSGGYFIDYQLTPSLTMVSAGDLLAAAAMNSPIKAAADASPFLYRRMGKWRLVNQYFIDGGVTFPPLYSSPWSTNTGFSSSPATPLASATATFQSLSDTLGIAPNFQAGDMLVFNTAFTALVGNSNGTQHSIAQVGFGLVQGGALLNTGGFPSVLIDAQSTVATAVPCRLHGMCYLPTSGITLPTTALSVCIWGRLDLAPATGTFNLDFIGPWVGQVLQYRPN